MSKPLLTFDHRICGIPCQIQVTYFHNEPPWSGSAETAPSDLDYYGYCELEFDVLDRRGRKAEWLERKLDEESTAEIESAAIELLT